MTGRAAGYCAGYAVPGYMNGFGRGGFGGFGRGGRGGRGFRNQFYATGLTGWQRGAMGWPAGRAAAAPVAAPVAAPISREQQLGALKEQAEYFADALESIKQQIADLESASKND